MGNFFQDTWNALTGKTGAEAAEKAAQAQVNAAELAADATYKASQEANALMKEMFDISRADYKPWREAGAKALSDLQKETKSYLQDVKAGPGDYTKSPGYEFRLGEGFKAMERAASASGKLGSGAFSKAMTRYAEDYATSDYDNFLNRYYNKMNLRMSALTPLQSLSGVGLTAAGQTGTLGSNYASQASGNIMGAGQGMANAYMSAGDARASGYINAANAKYMGAQNAFGLFNYGLDKGSSLLGQLYTGGLFGGQGSSI